MRAGRITLLILMTGLFASAWSSDRGPHSATPSLVHSQPSNPPAAVRITALHRWDNGSAVDEAAARNRDIPLAHAIPMGTYLVISPNGETDRVVIHSSPSSRISGELPVLDHFVSEANGKRQHWIRVTDSSPAAIGHGNVVEVLKDLGESWETRPVPSAHLQNSLATDPANQRRLSPRVRALTKLRRDTNHPIASEAPVSISR